LTKRWSAGEATAPSQLSSASDSKSDSCRLVPAWLASRSCPSSGSVRTDDGVESRVGLARSGGSHDVGARAERRRRLQTRQSRN
jgi:hypothetical protein